MDRDDALRDALRSGPAGPLPTDEQWSDVQGRAGRIHRRRVGARAAIALVTVLAVTIGVLTAVGTFDGDDSRSIVATPPGEQAEGDIVAALRNRLVVMTDKGEIVRTLVEGLDFGAGVSVTPDGQTVYFSRGACDDAGAVSRVSITGGPSEQVVGDSDWPLVSPDGRWIAYRVGATGCSDNSATPSYAGVSEIDGANFQLNHAQVGMRPFAWTPEGPSLYFGAVEAGSRLHVYLAAPPWSQASDDAVLDATSGTVRSDSSILLARPRTDGYEVVVYSGSSLPLFHSAGRSPIAISANAEGRVLAQLPDGKLQVQAGTTTRTIAHGVHGAAWLPTGASTEPPPSSVPVPSTTTPVAPSKSGSAPTIVAALENRLVTMTDQGEIVGTLVEGLDLGPGVSVTPDGGTVYFSYGSACADPAGGASGVARVPTSGGSREKVVGGSSWPLVSPNGRWLAYEIGGEPCLVGGTSTIGLTDLSTGTHHQGFLPSDAEVVSARPLAWTREDQLALVARDPSGRTLLYTVDVPDMTTRSQSPTAQGNLAVTAAATVSGSLVGALATPDGYEVRAVGVGVPRYSARGPRPVSLSDRASKGLLVLLEDGTLQIQRGSDAPRTIGSGVQGATWLPPA
jgi:WD40-like Beta Propeller Repeat